MKLSIGRDELLRGLGRIQAIVERRGTLPILANALLDASADDQVTLAATDLEVGVVASLPARVQRKGAVTLGAKKLFEIVRELEDAEIALRLDEGSRVVLEAGSARFSLLSISPEEYPTIPGDSGLASVPIESALLGEMIDRTLYATSTDETRYNLNGVFMEAEQGTRVCFVATDGHRLAKVSRSLSTPVDFLERGIIVPRKGVAEIRKLCAETDGPLQIGLGENFLILRCPSLTLSTRLIDGEFPNYRQIMPSDHRIRLVVPRERLTHAVRRTSLVAHERSRGFRFILSDGQLELQASSPELGEARETLPVTYQGERMETGFSARYVLEMLGSMTAKELVIELNSELTPAQFRPADDPDEVAVVMPMRM
jgi:DNA polymerase-3 subunit beta